MKVAFFKGTHPGWKGWLGIATKWWENGAYSHCELVVDGPDADGLFTCWSSTYLDGGVRQTKIALPASDWDIIDLALTDAQQRAARAWFDTHNGEAYDLLGLFGFVWRREEGSNARWFCSEAVGAALGFPEAWRYDPCTFYQVLLGVQPFIALQPLPISA